MVCLSDDVLAGGALGDVELEHIDGCQQCRQLVAELAHLDEPSLEQAETEVARTLSYPDEIGATVASGRPEVTLERGSLVSRYVVLGKVGEGGMGAVYAAYDPELDRKIALKFLHSELTGHSGRSGEQTRLLREAQAMAQLSHPNVASVFDVGTFHGRVFIAIEFIEGMTLREWLDAKERDWHEVWSVLQGAGRGLAAAHTVNIIHRDFKPENVLVDTHNEAHVTDFGLARPTAAPVGKLDDLTDSSGALHKSLTRTGALMGTPRYMAPEQHLGGKISEHSDQFAFCLVVFEAMYKARAFAGDTIGELAHAVTSGELRQPSNRCGVPLWRHQVVERGLSSDPQDRYPTMTALLAALTPPRRRSRWSIVAAVLLVALVGIVTVGVFVGRRSTPSASPCENAEANLAGVWDDATRSQLAKAFAQTKHPSPRSAAAQVTVAIDNYAQGWATAHTRICEATEVAGSQSDSMLDLRMQCLSRRRDELAALTKLFIHDADPALLDRAVQATGALTPVTSCDDTRALALLIPPPDNPGQRGRFDKLGAQLVEVEAMFRTGRYESALPYAHKLLKDSREVGFAPQIARALFIVGRLQYRTGANEKSRQTLVDAVKESARAHDDRQLAAAYHELVHVVGNVMARLDEGLAIARAADVAIVRAGNEPRLRAKLLTSLGMIYNRKGQAKKAREYHTKALTLFRDTFGPTHFGNAVVLLNLGALSRREGKFAEALGHFRRAITITNNALGAHHPSIARISYSMGHAFMQSGKYEKAKEPYLVALRVWERTEGKNGGRVADALNSLAAHAETTGQYASARKYIQRSIDIRTANNPNHPNLGNAYNSFGVIAAAQHKHDEALKHYSRALSIWRKAYGANNIRTARAHSNIAVILSAKKKCPEAIRHFEHARAVYSKAYGAEHPAVARALNGIAVCHLNDGHSAKAAALLEKVIRVHKKVRGAPIDLGRAQFDLARALWPQKNERRRAIALAKQAHAILAAGGAGMRSRRDDVAKWLKKRR